MIYKTKNRSVEVWVWLCPTKQVLSQPYWGEWFFAASPFLNAERVGDTSLTNMVSWITGVGERSTLSYRPHCKTNEYHLSADTGNCKPPEQDKEGTGQLSPKAGIPGEPVELSIARMIFIGRSWKSGS